MASITIMVGQQAKLDLAFVPSSGAVSRSVPVTWTSSDPSVATLSAASGYPVTVTGVSAGSTTLTAAAGSGGLTTNNTVTVEDADAVFSEMNISPTLV